VTNKRASKPREQQLRELKEEETDKSTSIVENFQKLTDQTD
jgi:hypothetical protein